MRCLNFWLSGLSFLCVALYSQTQLSIAQTRAFSPDFSSTSVPTNETNHAGKLYWDGATKLEFPQSGVNFSLRSFFQTRYRFSDLPEGANNRSSFEVYKARFILAASIPEANVDTYFQGDLVGNKSQGLNPDLRDLYLAWHPGEQTTLRMGQYKVGISREYLNSDAKIQFPDRSIPSDFFDFGRLEGASLSGNTPKKELEYSASIFNGTSDGEGINLGGKDLKHLGASTLRWNALGKMDAFEEGDLRNTTDLAASFGLAFAYGEASNAVTPTSDATTSSIRTFNIDANLKYRGFSVHTEYYMSQRDVEQEDDASPQGGYLQTGYFILPGKLELVGRGSYLNCDNRNAGDVCAKNGGLDWTSQASVGLNYQIWEHVLKLQLAYDYIVQSPEDSAANDLKSHLVTAQLQLFG